MQSFVPVILTVNAALLHAMDLHRRLLKGEGSTLACLALGLYIYSELVKVLTARHWQPQRMGHCMSYCVRYSCASSDLLSGSSQPFHPKLASEMPMDISDEGKM